MQPTRVAAPLAMLLLSHPVPGQDSLDLAESDARNEAYNILSAAEARFDCRFEENAMQVVGNEPNDRYVFHVIAVGDECREALILATSMAAREDRLMFRQVQVEEGEPPDSPSGIRDGLMGPLLIYDDQVLIDEVNPEIDGIDPGEE